MNLFRKVLERKEAAADKVTRARGNFVLRSHFLTSASMTSWPRWRSPSVSELHRKSEDSLAVPTSAGVTNIPGDAKKDAREHESPFPVTLLGTGGKRVL